MNKKIAILGASYLQLPLVLKAKENNLEVHCFAWDDEKAVCKKFADYFYDISVVETEKILEKSREIGINGIATIATDVCIPTMAKIAKNLNLNGNSTECANLTTNKGLMRSCFHENKIPSPKFKVINSDNEIEMDNLKFPVIVKPTDRSGSLGVTKIENPATLKNAIEASINFSLSKSCIVEEFITGAEVSVETISYKGQHKIITVTDKTITKEPYFVELAHHQPSQHTDSIIERIHEIAVQILNATKVENGASHIELKITNDGNIYAIEIGSRMGGDFIGSDLVELSTGFDYLQAVIDVALNRYKNDVQLKLNKFSGVYFLSKNTEKLLPYFDDYKKFNFDIIKKEIQNKELIKVKSSNDRSGFLIYQANKKIDLL
ncbi:MAG: ATP-grasp domain-containing protein [Flavobacterium sp.]|nr:ATP-grasp domain-containing protein [Flavobacterium sp.]